MFHEVEGGTLEVIQGINCWIPKEGEIWDPIKEKWLKVGVHRRSTKFADCFWEPDPRWQLYRKWQYEEQEKQKADKSYRHAELGRFMKEMWQHRRGGFWFYNNDKPTYITGIHWYFLSVYQLERNLPDYREIDRQYFYVWASVSEDPDFYGVLEMTKRRNGKSYRAGCIALYNATEQDNFMVGIQSKAWDDAEKFFKKCIIAPYRKLPEFWQPKNSNLSSGTVAAKTGLQFKAKGKTFDGYELESGIDAKPSGEAAYDGQRLGLYIGDEVGKCFGKGTPIRMFDGAIKAVEDVAEGDIVMGDDSTPRHVFGVTSGREEMFRVIPNKGESWACNKSHILSLKWCNTKHYKGWQKEQTVNISVGDFLALPGWVRRHLMLYRVGQAYPEQQHSLAPYYLGLWLGDGSADGQTITNIDPEVIEYLQGLCDQNGLTLVKRDAVSWGLAAHRGHKLKGRIDGVDYSFDSMADAARHFKVASFAQTSLYRRNTWERTEGFVNPILNDLRSLNLLQNKHIPESYLRDSERNRLQVLAGLVDSDGYVCFKEGRPSNIEITQKRYALAKDIQELARGLGFHCSFATKIARMKRSDKSVYECEVYRVMIYGDLHRIPTKVNRKKCAEIIEHHANRRNPARSGFTIESIGGGEYFGFAVDGNHLFQLADGTVVHNTSETDIYDRYTTIKPCLQDHRGQKCGNTIHTTTVEDMGPENRAFPQLWADSDQYNRKANGRTKSGLARLFFPADQGHFADKYGFPLIEKSRAEILGEREGLDQRAQSQLKRKFPLTEEEALQMDDAVCPYNIDILNQLEADLRGVEDKLYVRGNFHWENGERDGKVIFRPASNGRFKIAWMPPEELQNLKAQRGPLFIPMAREGGSIGIDPYDHKVLAERGQYSMSLGAIVGVKRPDPLAGPKDMPDGGVAFIYLHRWDNPNDFYEDAVMAATFYGWKALIETNKPGCQQYFEDRGYIEYTHQIPGRAKRGIDAAAQTKGTGTTSLVQEATAQFIEDYHHTVVFLELVQQWKAFNPMDTTKFDLAMAFGYAYMVMKRSLTKTKKEVKQVPLRSLMPYLFKSRRASFG